MPARVTACVFAVLSLAAAQTVQEFESSGRALKQRGDAIGALAQYERAATLALKGISIIDLTKSGRHEWKKTKQV